MRAIRHRRLLDKPEILIGDGQRHAAGIEGEHRHADDGRLDCRVAVEGDNGVAVLEIF